MGTVRGFFTVWEECGGDQVEERSLSRVGALFKDGGCVVGQNGPSAQDLS